MKSRRCSHCKSKHPQEQMLLRGLKAFCNQQCFTQYDAPAAKPLKRTKPKSAGGKSKAGALVSEPIRNSARGEACSLRVAPECRDGDTVVLCHLNSQFRGVGLKSPDIFGVYGCAACHRMLDASMVSHKDQQRAHQETLMKLIKKGLVTVA